MNERVGGSISSAKFATTPVRSEAHGPSIHGRQDKADLASALAALVSDCLHVVFEPGRNNSLR